MCISNYPDQFSLCSGFPYAFVCFTFWIDFLFYFVIRIPSFQYYFLLPDFPSFFSHRCTLFCHQPCPICTLVLPFMSLSCVYAFQPFVPCVRLLGFLTLPGILCLIPVLFPPPLTAFFCTWVPLKCQTMWECDDFRKP